MKHDTPLPEVAHHLSLHSARILGGQAGAVQQAVLSDVRAFVVYLEEQGVSMDTVTYEVVLDAFVAKSITASAHLVHLYRRLQYVHQAAQELVENTRMQA